MHERIRQELDEVRYYNDNRGRFQREEAIVGKNRAVYDFEKYNSLIQTASTKLYEFYFEIRLKQNPHKISSINLTHFSFFS